MSTFSENFPPDPATPTDASLQASANTVPGARRPAEGATSRLGEAESEVFAALLSRSDELFAVTDLEHRLLYLNPAGRALLGLSAIDEFAGELLIDLLADGHRDAYRDAAMPALLARGEWAGETCLLRQPAGPRVPIWLKVSVLPQAASHQPWLAFVGRDLSETQGLARALASARGGLERASQAAQIGEMAAAVAHEVSQPLAAMVADAQACAHWLARDPPRLAEALAAAAHVTEVGLRGGQLLERVRALVRQSAAHSAELDVNDVIRQALQVVHTGVAAAELSLSLKLHPHLPLVLGDAAQLQQVVMNLIDLGSQAVQARPLAQRQLEIVSQLGLDGDVVVEVRDTGDGTALALRPDGSRPDDGGLPALRRSRRIVEAHGGRLWLVRSDARGTVVACSLPPMPARPDGAGDDTSGPASSNGPVEGPA